MKLRRRQTGIDTPLTDQMVIGRLAECGLTVNEASVSRRHARIERRGESWWVVDLGSSNGVSLNGQRSKEFQIQVGDLVTFGAVAFDVLAVPKQRLEVAAEQIQIEEIAPTSTKISAPAAATSAAGADDRSSEPSQADRERARLHRELRGSKHSSGLGDLSQQPLWLQMIFLALGLVVIYGVVLGVRWLMSLIAPTV